MRLAFRPVFMVGLYYVKTANVMTLPKGEPHPSAKILQMYSYDVVHLQRLALFGGRRR